MQQSADGKQPQEFLSTHPGNETTIKRLTEKMPEALALYNQAQKAPVAQLPPVGGPATAAPLAQQQ
jgi:NaMN:DMB phosphoribosyltransferase